LAAVAFIALAGAPRIALAGDIRPAGSPQTATAGRATGENTNVPAAALAILVPVLLAGGAIVGGIVWRLRAERRASHVPAVTPSSTPPDTTPVFCYTRRPRPHSARYVVR